MGIKKDIKKIFKGTNTGDENAISDERLEEIAGKILQYWVDKKRGREVELQFKKQKNEL